MRLIWLNNIPISVLGLGMYYRYTRCSESEFQDMVETANSNINNTSSKIYFHLFKKKSQLLLKTSAKIP